MKKKICIFLVGIVVIAALALFVVPQIPVRKFEPVTHTMLEEDEAYERAYNLYGKVIFKDRRKALDKFKKDYKNIFKNNKTPVYKACDWGLFFFLLKYRLKRYF